MALTDEQLAFLQTRRKNTPPSVFRSAQNAALTIDPDTEDALILAPPESKRKAVDFLRLVLGADSGSTEHDAVLALFTDQQATVRKTLSTSLGTIISSFDNFKDGLINSGREPFFANGLAPLISILIKGLGVIKQEADTSEYHSRLAEVAKSFHGGRLTDNDQKEMRSWVRALLSYP